MNNDPYIPTSCLSCILSYSYLQQPQTIISSQSLLELNTTVSAVTSYHPLLSILHPHSDSEQQHLALNTSLALPPFTQICFSSFLSSFKLLLLSFLTSPRKISILLGKQIDEDKSYYTRTTERNLPIIQEQPSVTFLLHKNDRA